jgi:hypothetical protein
MAGDSACKVLGSAAAAAVVISRRCRLLVNIGWAE